MQQFANGSGATVGLVGSEDGPPLSPETVGRAPGILDAPVPLRPLPGFPATAPAVPTQEEPAADPPPAAEAAETRRVVIRLLGGEELELGSYDDREGAVAAAQELIARFCSAEEAGEWPEIAGRFLRLDAVASIDVLSAE